MLDIKDRPMFPHVFDSSMISAFKSCNRKGAWSYIDHYKPKGESIHLHAGGAFAKGLEVARNEYYLKKTSREDSVAIGMIALMEAYGDFSAPEGSSKTLDRMMGAFEYFNESFPLGDDNFEPLEFHDNKLGIEFSFAEPLDVLHPITQLPILFSGRADMIGHYMDGIYLEDDKTTSSLGASWAKQWELRSQFSAYCWAAKKILKLPIKGVLVRGISILKTKYETLPTITYRADWEIERWKEQTERDIRKLIQSWEEGYYDYNLDYSCNEYGGCQFNLVCKSKHPDTWLESDFERKVWSPLDRKDVSVKEWEDSWNHGN